MEEDLSEMRVVEGQFIRGTISRREFVARAAALGMSFTAAGGLIAACSSAATSAPAQSAAPSAASSSATGSATSCAGAYSVVGNKKPQFGWAIGLSDNPIITTMQKTMTAFAGEMGWEPLWDSATNANVQQMIPAVQAWVTAGVPVLMVDAFDPGAFEPIAKQAKEKGLIWVVYNSEMSVSDGQIAFPPCDAAEMVGAAAVEWINKNNPTAKVLITSSPRQPQVVCKWDRVKQIIDEGTEAQVVAIQEGNNRTLALQVTQATLQAHPDLSVVIATNDDAAMGVVGAFKAVNADPAKVAIVSYDGAEDALRELKSGGYIKYDAALNLKRLAQKMVMAALYLGKTGVPVPQPSGKPMYFTEPPAMVTKDSPELDEILAFYDAAK